MSTKPTEQASHATDAERAELARAQDRAIVAGKAGVELKTLDDYRRFAIWVEASGLQPKGMTVPQMVIAIELGANIGLKPMQSIQSIAIINNRPTIWGDGLRAVILSHPLCEEILEWSEGEGDNETAYCQIRRRGRPDPVKRHFSTADAKRAGLWGKPGPWTQYPQRMRPMRAFSWAARDAFADALRGIQIAEEVADYVMHRVDWVGTAARLQEPRAKSGGVPAASGAPADSLPAAATTDTPTEPAGGEPLATMFPDDRP